MKKTDREWYNYTLRAEGKVVYFGITKQEAFKRIMNHIDGNKYFTSYTIDQYPKTFESAKALETKRILQHARSHNGKYPKYNKIL
jgi:predicted GIY-YIG superfamily endonuclease